MYSVCNSKSLLAREQPKNLIKMIVSTFQTKIEIIFSTQMNKRNNNKNAVQIMIEIVIEITGDSEKSKLDVMTFDDVIRVAN